MLCAYCREEYTMAIIIKEDEPEFLQGRQSLPMFIG